jgi:hypothetical protein
VESEFTASVVEYETNKARYEGAKDLEDRLRLLDEMNAPLQKAHEVLYRCLILSPAKSILPWDRISSPAFS